jgi:uncharacterized protein (TIGR00106 family)
MEGRKLSKINLSLQVIPNVADELVYPVVDKVIAMIEESGLTYEVGPMETTIEGELDELMEIVKKAQYVCVKEGATRVISMVKIDYKPEGVTINEKIGKYRTEKEVQRT